MGWLQSLIGGKPRRILSEEDIKQLDEIQRQSYINEARLIMERRGRELAHRELEIKTKEKF